MNHAFTGTIDTWEDEGDRVQIRFVERPGCHWVKVHKEELVTTLRRAQYLGSRVEVVFNVQSLEIEDVLER